MSEAFNSDFLGSFSELVGTSTGNHISQSGDPADETDACLHQQQSSAPWASDLHLFGGDDVSCASPSLFWGSPRVGSVLAETSCAQTRPDVPLSKSEYNRLLFKARTNSMGDAEMKLPWEQGVWKSIFADNHDDDDVFPTVVPPVPGEYLFPSSSQSAGHDDVAPVEQSMHPRELVTEETTLPYYSFAVRVLQTETLWKKTGNYGHRGCTSGNRFFEILNHPGAVGKALLQEQVETDPNEGSAVLRDSLGIKSPRTVIKRAQTLLQYLSWLQMHVPGWSPWDRKHCLQYLAYEEHARSSASRGMTLLEPFRFARFVLEIPISEQHKPARPSKVVEVAALEKLIASHSNPIDVYMLGAVFFAVLSRSRWSDLKMIHQLWIEKVEFSGELYGFVEARTRYHKTATTLAKKQRFMPLVAPFLGVTNIDWTKHWVQAMESLGVSMESEPFGALCKAPSHDGSLCRRSCSTEEIGTFLNKVLKTNQETGVTSLSLKHTTLSWCAAYGMDEPARTLLGHHELQGAKAMTVYSRDLLTRPLQLSCSMLANIRMDHFRPDESRTARMVNLLRLSTMGQSATERPNAVAAEGKVTLDAGTPGEEFEPTSPLGTEAAPAPNQAREQEESSDIASTSSSSGSSDEGDEQPACWIPGPVWRNIRSHVVHRCSSVKQQTSCGRLIDDEHFGYMADGCSTINARCSRCFKGEVVSSVDGLVEALDQSRSKRQRAK